MFENAITAFLAASSAMIPFKDIKSDEFLPTFRHELRLAREKIQRISQNSAPATFENTILTYEDSQRRLNVLDGIYAIYKSNLYQESLKPDIEEINRLKNEWLAVRLANHELFARIESVYSGRESLPMDEESQKLLEEVYKSFANEGAKLSPEAQTQLKAIRIAITEKMELFKSNLLSDARGLGIWVTDATELQGIPSAVVDKALVQARKKENDSALQGKWFFSLDNVTSLAILKFARVESVRQRMFQERSKLGRTSGNNLLVLRDLSVLRHRQAQLLGHENYSDYRMADLMAKNRGNVLAAREPILADLAEKARQEFSRFEAFVIAETGSADALIPLWNRVYWSERFEEARYAIDEEQLKPYFKLENVLASVYAVASKLTGLRFEEIPGADVFHEDVKLMRVSDAEGRDLAIIYADYFLREGTKREGAWFGSIRSHGLNLETGRLDQAIGGISTNFLPSTEGRPSLLTPDNVRTVFHEFGHMLHDVLGNTRYQSLVGTNVPWDFVEVPSKMFERWAYNRDFLKAFARHHATGEAMPDDLIERLVASRNFNAATKMRNMMFMEDLDFAWHVGDLSHLTEDDIINMERELRRLHTFNNLPDNPRPTFSAQYSHIGTNPAYPSAYYSYAWSDQIAADLHQELSRDGVLNDPSLNQRLCRELLSLGGTRDPRVMIRNVLGRDVDPSALMRDQGL